MKKQTREETSKDSLIPNGTSSSCVNCGKKIRRDIYPRTKFCCRSCRAKNWLLLRSHSPEPLPSHGKESQGVKAQLSEDTPEGACNSSGVQNPESGDSKSTKGCGKEINLEDTFGQDMPLYVRTYECKNCDLVIDRDYNSAKNILRLGMSLCGDETSTPLVQVLSEKQEGTNLNFCQEVRLS